MKKTSLLINVILALAVAVLYVLHFVSPTSEKTTEGSEEISSAELLASGGIVYVNIDSVLKNFTMYEDVMTELQNNLKTKEAEFNAKQRTLERNFTDAQNKISKGLVTRAEAAQLEQNLQIEQQQLMQLQQQMQMELAEKEQVEMRKVLNAIMEHLKAKEADQKYEFVLGTTFGDNVLYANDNLNITDALIEGLNTEYNSEK